ncbi:Protein of unknown function DUF58 [Marine Group I thaumarchaeote SCGC RSA3]|uniref:DUF58 domain-containing protein n=3 Tax=Marine Group I TaxID=905826 RepID=A0A081RLB1_9ARCH|nr:Protein of unknown function DUF58 [Marine Group I thaumarchaeote SCGC AAA799-N04]KFM16850.1 Protein of unknown function DUF58 [Marine Group I thaumarchaeote SCGC AAA799-D11]KFM18907.1 Protein of unknown function DUF58 [Marine Group I thaumarchaeote SCGC RSA3]
MNHTKEILSQVKKLEFSTRHLVDGLLSGNYNSVFKGQGIEFSEIRDYRAGDDTRAIDWKVTARFNRPFIKEFIEERDLHVYFVIDMSGSGSFGTNISKKNKSFEIIASLMFAALRNNDKIGSFLITDSVEKFIPARAGRKHLLYSLGTIVSFTPRSVQTNLENALIHISKTIKRKSIVFVISDFIDETKFLKPLKILRKRHDVIALKISDQRELEIPDVGLIELEDEETGEQILVDTSDVEFRDNYSNLIREKEKHLLSELKKIRIDTVSMSTEQDYGVVLKKFFKKRR